MRDPARFAVLLLAIVSLATITESQKPTTPKAKALPVPVITCSDSDSTQACNSLKGLVAARDPDILGYLGGGKSYACFHPKEDVFFLVLFTNPQRDLRIWSRTNDSRSKTYPGLAIRMQFEAGAIDQGAFSAQAKGLWSKASDDDPPVFDGQYKEDDGKGEFSISESELTLDSTYLGGSKREISYHLSLRLSTGRFIERYSHEGDKPLEYFGKCLAFNEGKALN